MIKQSKLILLFTLLFIFSCMDLNVENINAPDADDALQSPSDVESLIGGAYFTFFNATEYWYPTNGLSVLADELTSSWGNAAMQDLSSEPRVAFNNNSAYIDIDHLNVPWNLYSAISSVNDGLSVLLSEENPLEIGVNGQDNMRAIAFSRFIQGISYCFLGSFFDQGYIIDENTDLTNEISLSSHSEVTTAGIEYLKKCITISEENQFTIPSNWINEMVITNDMLVRICNSYIARYLACSARTPQERENANWGEINSHIDAGLLVDEKFGPWSDNYINWYSDHRYISSYEPWTRADYKTIGLTDTSGNYSAWLNSPVEERNEFLIHTADRRITGADGPESEGSLFNYVGNSQFLPQRGTYHFSYYVCTKYNEYIATGVQQFESLTGRESRLLKAEYLYRQGDLVGAVEIINESRVTKGQLAPLTGGEDGADIWKWLKYEKKIETFCHPGLAFFDRRGWIGDEETGQITDLVQGSPLHFPVPALDLELGGITNYTHGGEEGDFAPKLVNVFRFYYESFR